MGLGLDSPSHWVIIAALALLLFGYKKLPDMARSAGKSLRIFKTEMKGMADDDDARSEARGSGTAAEATPVRPVEAAAPPAPVTPTAPAATSATTVHPPAAELPGPHGEIPVAQAPAPVTTAAVAPHEAGTESAPPRPV